jgi:SAM-dependent methyltransferase
MRKGVLVATTSDPLQTAAVYWDAAAETYEQKFTGTTVGQIRRRAVWKELERTFHPGQSILELNCGTGIDAVFLGRKGIQVLACDISPRMIEIARSLADEARTTTPPEFRVLATESLPTLKEGPFDGAFSNFAGLNCVADLAPVAASLAQHLKPGARFIACMVGRFVPFEIAWYLAHCEPRRAFQRLFERRSSFRGEEDLTIYRPTVGEIVRQMQPSFRLLRWKGIGITVPISYAEKFAGRYPRLIRQLATIDNTIGKLPLFRGMGDCVLLEFERTGGRPYEARCSGTNCHVARR